MTAPATPAAVLAFLRRVAAAPGGRLVLTDATPSDEWAAAYDAFYAGLARLDAFVSEIVYTLTDAGRARLATIDEPARPRGGCADDGAPETDRGDLAPDLHARSGALYTYAPGADRGDCGPLPPPEPAPPEPVTVRELLRCAADAGPAGYTHDASGRVTGKVYRLRPTAAGLAALEAPPEPAPAWPDDAQRVRILAGVLARVEAERARAEAERVDAARAVAAEAAGLPSPAAPALALLRTLVEAPGAGWHWCPAGDPRHLAALVLSRAGLARLGPSPWWAAATDRGRAFLDALDALDAHGRRDAAPEPPPAPRAPLSPAALDALSDDDAAALLDGGAPWTEEALHLARRYALDAARLDACDAEWSHAGVSLHGYAGAVTADAYALHGATRRTVAMHQGPTDRAAAVGLARKLLDRRRPR